MAALERVSMGTGRSGNTAEPSARRKMYASGNGSAVRCCQIRAWGTIGPNTLPVRSSRRPSKGKLVCGSRPLTAACGQHPRVLHPQLPSSKLLSGSRVSVKRDTRARVKISQKPVDIALVAESSKAWRHKPTLSVDLREGHDLERLLWP